MRLIRLESDVRKMLRDEAQEAGSKNNLFWAEANRGGTIGIADLFVVARINGAKPELVPVETKRGIIREGVLEARLRPSQKRFAKNAEAAGIQVFCCVGLHGTRRLIFCRSLAILTGKTTAWVEYSGWNRPFSVPFGLAPSSTFSFV